MVDNLGPSLTVHAPANGFNGANNFTINLSALDDSKGVSSFGYFINSRHVFFNLSNTSANLGSAAVTTTNAVIINLTAGTYAIKFRANDSFGNVVNSSEITITLNGPIDFADKAINTSLMAFQNFTLANITLFNASGAIIGAGGDIRDVRTKH